MKTVPIKLAIFQGWHQPPRMLDWEGIPTTIPGLFITKARKKQDDTPAAKGWNVTHKDGMCINPIVISSLPKAKAFVELLTKLDWNVSMDVIKENLLTYSKSCREAWEKRK
jgi:hypothetical protein